MEFRQLDPRIGRWLSTDPVTHHQFSPYSTFDNNPIYWSDPTGADSENKNKDDNKEKEKGEEETNMNGGEVPAPKHKVAIDAGHGIKGNKNPKVDPGAVSGGEKEKDLALDISKAVNSFLAAYGVDPLMIRSGDVTVKGNSLTYRTDKAKKGGAEMFISIHINSASNPKARGFTVLYKNKGANASKNKKLAENIANSQGVVPLKKNKTSVRNDLSVLNRFSSTGPAVLIEVGFITNSDDVKLMKTKANEIGRDIAKGIYFTLYNKYPSAPPVSNQVKGIQ